MRRRKITLRKVLSRLGLGFAVFFLVSSAASVFLWMLSLSLKSDLENVTYPPVLIPQAPTLTNFVKVFTENDFLRYTINSIIVTFGATGVALVVGVMAGYGISRLKAKKFVMLILVARITPPLSYLVPLYLMFQWFGMLGSLLSVFISHLIITIPIFVYIMVGFFDGLPTELEDAARVDGANPWQSFWLVSLPLVKPGITVAAILAFIGSWNNFILGVILGGRDSRTLPVAVYNTLAFEQVNWGPLAASALIVTAPVLLLTLLMQKQIIAGLTAGGVKGG